MGCGNGREGAGATVYELPPLPQKPPVGLFHRRRPQGRSTSTATDGGAGRFNEVCVPVKIINESSLLVPEGCGYEARIPGNTRPRNW